MTAMLVRAENGATCLESSVHGPVATGFYQCECAVGWHGANCASDVRPHDHPGLFLTRSELSDNSNRAVFRR